MATQQAQVLAHLQSGQTLTPMQALDQFGSFRLATIIHRLRADGHNILTEIPATGKKYAIYRLATGPVMDALMPEPPAPARQVLASWH
ncbi:MAG: helix-turn-helix domain-containing protein [Promicromonosporaceae bacterium]|nr:helix-turn-helix domain-containing protein [Promicromonosporaceae bacterium]